MIFSTGSQSHSRVVGVYMIFYAIGSGAGSIASTTVYANYGWSGVCWLQELLFSLMATCLVENNNSEKPKS